jgi:hypothetical protein
MCATTAGECDTRATRQARAFTRPDACPASDGGNRVEEVSVPLAHQSALAGVMLPTGPFAENRVAQIDHVSLVRGRAFPAGAH